MELTINGEKQTLPQQMTVAALLAHLGIDVRQVAVERNLEIVPKSTFADTLLCAGDQIEIVEFIGGG
jgi:thiamine biosynthesis protein ThiS